MQHKEMENSDTTISSNYFETLWPLILKSNECDINSSNTCEYFVPKQKFDILWAHEFLAEKCFDDYEPAIELRCKETADTPTQTTEQVEQQPYRGPHKDILPLDQQLAVLQQDVEIRKKLAHDFANRIFPWYIQRRTYRNQDKITEEIKQLFKDQFEFEIFQKMQHFQCHLMIIDVAPDVPLRNMERWLKFSPYTAIVTVIHDKNLYRTIKNFNQVFRPVLMEENLDFTWQEELERAIDVGVKMAKELFILEDVSQPMVFIFSQNRGLCSWDQFKILKKS